MGFEGTRRVHLAVMERVRAFLSEECGQDLIECALVGFLVGLGAVVVMHGLASTVSSAFANTSSRLVNAI